MSTWCSAARARPMPAIIEGPPEPGAASAPLWKRIVWFVAIAAAAAALGPVCRAHGVALILNDRPDLAAELDCDGVYIGQDDAPYTEARRLVGMDRIVGVTCHDSRHLALEAAEAGADYVAFGAFFPTATKAAPTRAEPELLSIWQETMLIPCVAIGGITAANARGLAAAGADFLAVCSGV